MWPTLDQVDVDVGRALEDRVHSGLIGDQLVDDGILLRRYWFSVSDAEQDGRFPYQQVQRLPPRPPTSGYVRPPRELQSYVPDHAASKR